MSGRVVATAAGYETTCSSIERWLRTRYEPHMWAKTYGQANLPHRLTLPWVTEWRVDPAVIGDSSELALLRCAEGIAQCDYCRRGQARRAWQATMDAVPVGPCVYCGAPEARTVDHVIPQAQDGPHHPANLVRACRDCNSRKGKLTPEEWAATGRAPDQWTIFARSSADVVRLLPELAGAA